MTGVIFFENKDGVLCGFEISGHSSVDGNDGEGKIVCASVSSAAYMAANTVGEVVGDKYLSEIEDGRFYFLVPSPSAGTVTVLRGLELHLEELAKQYSKRIEISRRCKKC